MATFIDINLDYTTSLSRPVRAEADIGSNPGYQAGRQVAGAGSGYRTPTVKNRRIMQLLGKDSCNCKNP